LKEGSKTHTSNDVADDYEGNVNNHIPRRSGGLAASSIGAPVSSSRQEGDQVFFKHIRRIYKYLAALEKSTRASDLDDTTSPRYFSDCIEPLNNYVRRNFLSDNDSSRGSLITTMTSGFSEMALLKPNQTFSSNINKGSAVIETAKNNFSLSNGF
jgi:hypothetical protein